MSWPTPGCVKLIDAMVVAEGGPDAFVRAVRISVPSCMDYGDARGIAANTIGHALWDWMEGEMYSGADGYRSFVMFLGSRWAPIGADNDPGDLNRNWTHNVLASLKAHGVSV